MTKGSANAKIATAIVMQYFNVDAGMLLFIKVGVWLIVYLSECSCAHIRYYLTLF
jgi:hypothetical protein